MSEVLLNTFMALEIYGLIRRSALERTSVMPSYFGGDKIVLAQLSLIGRYHLLSEPLFYRRCHPGQFSYQRSDGRPGSRGRIIICSWISCGSWSGILERHYRLSSR